VSRTDDPFHEPGDRFPLDAGPSEPSGGGSSAPSARDGRSDDQASDGRASDADTPAAPATTREPTPATQWIGRVVIVLLAVLFGFFAVDNSQAVDFSWVFGETRVARDGSGGVPLIVLLVVAAAIGAVFGALIEWQFLRGRRARRKGG
jgi:uncharacterized integral membrane protein